MLTFLPTRVTTLVLLLASGERIFSGGSIVLGFPYKGSRHSAAAYVFDWSLSFPDKLLKILSIDFESVDSFLVGFYNTIKLNI